MTDTIPVAVTMHMANHAYGEAPAEATGIDQFDVERMLRAALKAASAMGWELKPREPTEAMMLAGREPIMARDCLQGGDMTLGEYMEEAGKTGWAEGRELDFKNVTKGDCAVMTYRAMYDSAPKVE